MSMDMEPLRVPQMERNWNQLHWASESAIDKTKVAKQWGYHDKVETHFEKYMGKHTLL